MPLVRIDLVEGRPDAARQHISAVIHRALVETMGVTDDDRYHIITEHPAGRVLHAPRPGDRQTDALVVISITLNVGRTAAMKQAFYRRVVQLLNESLGLLANEVFIGLVEVDPDNWWVP